MNIVVVGGQLISLESMGAPLDDAFVALHAAYLGNAAYSLASFEAASLTYFSDHPTDPERHDAYFKNFTIIWQRFLATGNYDEAERVWALALSTADTWEAANAGDLLHKGTPFYFWAMTAIKRGDLDKGYALMHEAVNEDRRTTGQPIPDTPGFHFVSLNYEKTDQAFYEWVSRQAAYLKERQKKYSALHHPQFTLHDFQRKFLQAPPNMDVSFLFAYVVARLMMLGSLPDRLLSHRFASQIEANLFFDLLQVVDATIKAKNPAKWKFIDHARYLSRQAGQPLTIQQLQEINAEFNSNFDQTLSNALDGTLTLPRGGNLSRLQFDIAIAYGIRNRQAHDISGTTISARFRDVEQALLNVLFAAADYL